MTDNRTRNWALVLGVVLASSLVTLIGVLNCSQQVESGSEDSGAERTLEYFIGEPGTVYSQRSSASDSLLTLETLDTVYANPVSVDSNTVEFVEVYRNRDSSSLGYVRREVLWKDAHHPRLRRFTWQTVNIRAGPGTDQEVVEQEAPNQTIWTAPTDTSKWAVVFRNQTSADTVGYVYTPLIHKKIMSPEQREEQQDKAKLTARQTTAEKFERQMLEQGMDVNVFLIGPEDRTLHIEWVLAGRAEAYNLANDPEIMSNLRTMGIERLVISDGYGDSWSWEIQ